MAPAPVPHLTYRGGPLLTDVKVFTVYWGAGWQTNPQLVQMATKLDQFFGYSPHQPVARPPQNVVSDAKIQHWPSMAKASRRLIAA